MSVEVEGLDEALRRLKAYDTKSTEKISEAIRLGGQNIGKEARSRVPRRSGKLRKSIRTRFDSTAITSTVRTNVPYAHLVNLVQQLLQYGRAAEQEKAENLNWLCGLMAEVSGVLCIKAVSREKV